MTSDITKLKKIIELLNMQLNRKHKILLNQNEEYEDELAEDIEKDITEWDIPENLSKWIRALREREDLSNESKIMILYEYLCYSYTYDDNIIAHIKKENGRTIVPDWYGRDIDETWRKNRMTHNRRVCFEVSRILAASLKELLQGQEGFSIGIVYDIDLGHYSVGLASKEYIVTLDIDQYKHMKDLTRIKAGLTAKGIKVLEDEKGVFTRVLEQFNSDKYESSLEQMNDMITFKDATSEEPQDILYLRNAMNVLTERGMDAQGVFEYMKEIIDLKYAPENRRKVWKKIKGDNPRDTRYTRCLVVDLNGTEAGEEYLLDVDTRIIRPFSKEETQCEAPIFFEFKDPAVRGSSDRNYDGK